MKGVAEHILELTLERDFASRAAEAVEERNGIAVSEAATGLLAAVAYRSVGGPMLLAVAAEPGRIADDLSCFLPGEIFHMPAGPLSGDFFRPYDEAVGPRLKAARALRSGKMVVAGVEALLGGMPGELSGPWPLELARGSEVDLEELLRLLIGAGYKREYMVEGWGKIALRGGILDIFTSTGERPVRLEFVGERIESLREFNVITQRSLGELDRIEVFPAAEPGCGSGGAPASGLKVVAVNPDLIEAKARGLCSDTGREPPRSLLDGWGPGSPVTTLGHVGRGGARFPGEPVSRFRGDVFKALDEWGKLRSEGNRVYLLLEGKGQVDRIRELLKESGLDTAAVVIGTGSMSAGFSVPELKVALYTSADLFGRMERKRKGGRVSSGAPVTDYAELELDRYVVHEEQGIGVYRGLTSRDVLGVTREYLLIEYAEGDRLYVPTSQLSKVQRYVGSENPTVHRLRGRNWQKARRKARRSAEKTARELLRLYIERKTGGGHPFPPDSPWQIELEDAFEHEETPDQARVAVEVKKDMESDMAMDRLVCGDVGYGKTEVAVRAAMKAVLDSRQVAVLVPTTVLAKQHLVTFRSRVAAFPVRVEMLSRFLSKEEQKKIALDLKRGSVDVVIGTHRLLQDDIGFKDLGLLVIDEEQKFGVEHKEKLRRMSLNIDTLVLSATPIPRTLQMSLSGVRDISIIDTPPEDRHPISTYVGEYDMDLVRRAVNYEVDRGGQVFFVHNRIHGIERAADTLREAMRGTSVAVAHGRMEESELERIMLEFSEGVHDVLVCTTIIESGLDLPNVNTLIVDRADRLGLAQLYQIRGRVGRAGRRAYAYLFYLHRAVLNEKATARLATIAEMTPLGSGMKVALRDLEIRGAGDLLGREQSGQIEAVGFELYCQMLREAVEVLGGRAASAGKKAVVELPVDAYIPREYISDQITRVEMYRRFEVARGSGTLDELSRELADRFGEMPEQVSRMMKIEGIRELAGRAGLVAVTMRGDELQFKYSEGKSTVAALTRSAVGRCEGPGIAVASLNEDPNANRLYLKLRFDDVKKRQELLLKWLYSIIDDIIKG